MAFPSAARDHKLTRHEGEWTIMAESNKPTDEEERRAKLVKAGVTVGIGSAALVAALLYASTIKKKPR
jgi:hypothetical protein